MARKEIDTIINELRSLATQKTQGKAAYFGINAENFMGVSMPDLRKFARIIGKDHSIALELWKTKIHEAFILASLVDEPEKVTEKQIDRWTNDFNSWDVCDQCCINLFIKTPYARKKALEYCSAEKEFVKRCGFALIAVMAVHYKKEKDEFFFPFLKIIERESTDERNFVKKAVNWALRQIGKRNETLRKAAFASAKRILAKDDRTSKWIAKDALKELE